MNVNEDTIDNLKGIRTIAPLPIAYVRTRACEHLSLFTSCEEAPDCQRTCQSLSLPVCITPLPTSLMGEYIKRGNGLKQTQDVGGRLHKILLEDDLTDRIFFFYHCYIVIFFVLI